MTIIIVINPINKSTFCPGKSTYCRAIAHHLLNSVKRDVIIVNLDPANDRPPYEADVDVQSLIEVDEVRSEFRF